jgi:extradiol dioxygenase family protein
MKIKLTSVYVDDQDKALRFYTEVLGFCQEGRCQPGPISLADRGLARGAGRHAAATGAEQQSRGQGVWTRLPQVSFSIAMVEPVTSVGGILNSAPRVLIPS